MKNVLELEKGDKINYRCSDGTIENKIFCRYWTSNIKKTVLCWDVDDDAKDIESGDETYIEYLDLDRISIGHV
jgi:hypothetical protein